MGQYTLLRIKERMNKELYDSIRTHITIDGTMTRKEEIWNAICDLKIGSYDENNPSDNDKYDGSDIQSAFYSGAMWSDSNPKSPWISVEDDLPCNHEDMIFETNPLDKDTDCVLVRFSYGGVSIECMHCRGGGISKNGLGQKIILLIGCQSLNYLNNILWKEWSAKYSNTTERHLRL